ncbi:Phophatidylserine decarboxylase-domain-containing protein [Rhodocollybia butyracea]|uniref:Phophatidylserine decarboxylase-domain-containing protein n=1 Tax=Rhodocollybia butyracea TaxID=206335 RepID=A0A9P5Q4B5_9AGAR|nr:Phophatidylserine decarboxylase-domain-containing protein [Rhodocollybia butyracea]
MAPKTLRPSAAAFRNAGWLPKSKQAYDSYMERIHRRTQSGVYRTADALLHPVRQFKVFIESDPTVYGEFIRMFDNVDQSDPHTPKDYHQLLNMMNEIFREAPSFGDLGPPLYMVMAQIMNSQGGFSAFTKENLNLHFKKMFVTWSVYLTSTDSRSVLNTGDKGWFSTAALDALMTEYPGRTFAQVFECNPEKEYYGFLSFDDFFNRRFRDASIDRPTGPLDNNIVGAACESSTYAYQEDVKAMDELFIKDEAYSLRHLLAGTFVEEFVGGTVLQSFLNTTGYHRWHVPVNGTISKIVNVPGTYFAQGPYTIGEPTDDPDVAPPYLQSLRFFSNTAARALVFIQADDSNIGLMCFIAIGMTEISTCQVTVFEGQKVIRGQELGLFHFGGSSSALVFRKSTVQIDGSYKVPEVPLKINAPIGVAV